jgi:hypothetical protein
MVYIKSGWNFCMLLQEQKESFGGKGFSNGYLPAANFYTV